MGPRPLNFQQCEVTVNFWEFDHETLDQVKYGIGHGHYFIFVNSLFATICSTPPEIFGFLQFARQAHLILSNMF